VKINDVGMVKSDYYQLLIEVDNVRFFVYYCFLKRAPDIAKRPMLVFLIKLQPEADASATIVMVSGFNTGF